VTKGNSIFHVDSSFNPRRSSFSLLRAVYLPPPGNGGNTDFADSRTAFDELPVPLRTELLEHDYIGAHTIAQSRKLGSPKFFKDLDPSKEKMARHRVVQLHEPSGRTTLYVAAHCHHIEEQFQDKKLEPIAKSTELLDQLLAHVTQPKYVVSVEWHNPGDMIIWDNRCVMHRATGGAFEGKYVRDLRRTTVHDDGASAWGLNREDGNSHNYVSNAAMMMGQGQPQNGTSNSAPAAPAVAAVH
jgi:alpha-ketoglutarate-dependent 2,4-dichlorophenoxyacetate dioxygenase